MLSFKDKTLLLASKSPRRRALIEQCGFPFQVIDNQAPEDFPDHLMGYEIPVFLAKQKADYFNETLKENHIVVFADTIVWHENKVLNKPKDFNEAKSMLEQLSGKKHQVITGVCLKSIKQQRCFYDITEVYFKSLTQNEINYYIKNYKPYDKAGAYGIQEWIGCIGVEKINGSYFNVVGLPIQKLYAELQHFI